MWRGTPEENLVPTRVLYAILERGNRGWMGSSIRSESSTKHFMRWGEEVMGKGKGIAPAKGIYFGGRDLSFNGGGGMGTFKK